MEEASPDGHLVELRAVRKSFGDNVVLHDVDLRIARGEAVGVAGPSGSGKSTMLRCINGLEPVDTGEVRFDGAPLPAKGSELQAARARIGMVFQQFNLFPHMSVLDNVTLGPTKAKSVSEQDAKRRARELLERVGIQEKADQMPADLEVDVLEHDVVAEALAHLAQLDKRSVR